ncbi:MAG: FecR domain-containing protein [Sedimentisphaerales bacterium]|nr:FecR domain-containing protein [Sedimentisphaerales bacterium]MBN2843231.1 FecR domain-containing protein [Sedimentisphaerales bacterium]
MKKADNKYSQELIEVIILTFDGKVSEDQFCWLQEQINNNDQARECYFKLLTIYTAFNDYSNSGILFDELVTGGNGSDGLDVAVLMELAEEEVQAPGVEIVHANPVEAVKQYEPELRYRAEPVRKFSISGMVAAAALIFLVVYVKLNPLTVPVPAAHLTDSTRPVWSGKVTILNHGDSVFADEILILSSGIAELKTQRDVTVYLEGPAEFQFKSETELLLYYGHLYSQVARNGVGFTINTPNAMVVDLGTEFSVRFDRYDKSTQVQMYKGSAVISNKKDNSNREILSAGVAKAIDQGGSISDIAFDSSDIPYRTLSGYEKLLDRSNVLGYCSFNQRLSWVNKYVGQSNLAESWIYNNAVIDDIGKGSSGQPDCALYFSGTGQQSYARLERLPLSGKSSFTVALWFKVQQGNVPDAAKQFIASKFNPAQQVGWRIGLLDNVPFVRISDYGGDKKFHNWLSYDRQIEDGWHSIVMVVDRERKKFLAYLDGISDGWQSPDPELLSRIDEEFRTVTSIAGDLPDNVDLSNNVNLHIGIRSRSLDMQFSGWIYDIAIWNKALSSDKVKEIYSIFPLK